MKSPTTLFISLFIFIYSGAFAQWDLIRPDIPDSIFHIGGFNIFTTGMHAGDHEGGAAKRNDYNSKINMMKEAGMNADYQATGGSTFRAALKSMKEGLKGYDWFVELMGDKTTIGFCNDATKDRDDRDDKNPSYLGHWGGFHDASEARLFLSTNEWKPEVPDGSDFDYETNYSWASKLIDPVSSPNTNIAIEKEITTRTGTDIGGGYILKNLESFLVMRFDEADGSRNYRYPPNNTQGEFALSPRSDFGHISFIYRLNPGANLSGTPVLFEIEYGLVIATVNSNNDWVSDRTIPIYADGDAPGTKYEIKYSDFETYTTTSHPEEHPNIKSFPKSDNRHSTVTNMPYAVFTKKFRINGRKASDWGIASNERPMRIEVRVKRNPNAQAPIVVRGVRIRSDIAQNLLTAVQDPGADQTLVNHIKCIIDKKIKSYDKPASGDAYTSNEEWTNLSGWTGGNEPFTCDFRVWSVICSLARKVTATINVNGTNIVRNGKSIHMFTAQNLPQWLRHGYYRAIFEDQTGDVPPPLIMEGLEQGRPFHHPKYNSALNKCEVAYLPYPKDGIPAELLHDSKFIDLRRRKRDGRILMAIAGTNAINSDLKSDVFSTVPQCSTQSGIFDYQAYTDAFQWRLDFPYMPMSEAAYTAYPPYYRGQPEKNGKWYMNIPLMWSFTQKGEQREPVVGSNLERIIPEGGHIPPTTPVGAALRDQLTEELITNSRNSTTCAPNSHNVSLTEILPPQSGPGSNEDNNDFYVDYRPATATEMRAFAWYGICWGAKGIQYNALGSDGGNNVGMCGYTLEHDIDYSINPNLSSSSLTYPTLNFLNRLRLGTCDEPGLRLATSSFSDPSMTFPSDLDKTLSHNVVRNSYYYPGENLQTYRWNQVGSNESNELVEIVNPPNHEKSVTALTDGSIIGIILSSDKPCSAGICSVEVRIHKASTNTDINTGFIATLDPTNATYQYVIQDKALDMYEAGDEISVLLTTSSNWSATGGAATIDITVIGVPSTLTKSWKLANVGNTTQPTNMKLGGSGPEEFTIQGSGTIEGLELSTDMAPTGTCTAKLYFDNSPTSITATLTSSSGNTTVTTVPHGTINYSKNSKVKIELSQSGWNTTSNITARLLIANSKSFDLIVPSSDLVNCSTPALLRDKIQSKYKDYVADNTTCGTNCVVSPLYNDRNHTFNYDFQNIAPDMYKVIADRLDYTKIAWAKPSATGNEVWSVLTDDCSAHVGHPLSVRTSLDIVKNCTHDPSANGNITNLKLWDQSWHFSGPDWAEMASIGDPYVNIYTPWYYGFKEHWFGARKIMQDLKPIAQTLSELEWQRKTVGVSGLQSDNAIVVGANDKNPYFPLEWYTKSSQILVGDGLYTYNTKTITIGGVTKHVTDPLFPDRYVFTPDQNFEQAPQAMYEFGLFKNPKEESALYVTVMNRRTWPVRFRNKENGDDSNEDELPESAISDVNLMDDTSAIRMYDNWEDLNGTWHIDQAEDKLEGAKDVRRLSLRIRRDAFKNGQSIQHFLVTNLRTGRERLIDYGTQQNGSFVDTFSVVLEPGEGTLLKISPAYSIAAGMTSETGMAYNNGHRIAEIESTGFPPKRIMVWEKNGNIEYRVTNTPTPHLSGFENQIDPELTAGVVETATASLKNRNPSVASNNNNIVVVFSKETTDESIRQVFAHWGVFDNSNNTITWVDNDGLVDGINPFKLDNTVPKDVTNEKDQLVTPVVTPGESGFLCAWSNADDGTGNFAGHHIQVQHISLTQDNPPLVQSTFGAMVSEPNAVSSTFPTLASRDETNASDPGGWATNNERFHLAWEADWADGTSQIYYTSFDRIYNSQTITQGIIERVTKKLGGCKHRHPNIAVQNTKAFNPAGNGFMMTRQGGPIVTWESEYQPPIQHPQSAPGSNNVALANIPLTVKSVMVRRGNYIPNIWTSCQSISPIVNNLPLPMIQPGSEWTLIPHIPLPNDVTSKIFYNVTYMNKPGDEIRVSNIEITQRKTVFQSYYLPELGLYPNLPLNYKLGNGSFGKEPLHLGTLTFRGVNKFIDDAGNELYHARVTAPLVDNILKKYPTQISVVTINALANEQCKQKFAFSVGGPNLRPAIWCTGCPDTIYFQIGSGIPIPWNNYDITDTRPGYYSESDTTIFNWPRTEDSVRTEDFEYSLGDTLSFDRTFYMEDTAWVKTLINESTLSNINYSVLLKDSASGQTIATLDHITIDTASIDIAVKRYGEDNITSVSAFIPPMPSPTSFYVPQGPGRKAQWIANAPAPSGKAYITIHASKDEDMPVVMSQEHGGYDNFDVIIPTLDTVAFKQAGQQPISQSVSTTPITLTVNPNPFEGSTRVTVETVKDVPLSVQVYNVLGGLVADLYSDMSKQTHYEFTLDSKTIRPGTYFIRAQAGNGIVTKKVQFVK